MNQFSSVQSLSHVRLFVTPWIAACQASLSIINSRSSPKLMCIKGWCHPAISSSVIPFSSCPQSLPASESFPVSQFFAWGGQSTGVSALTSFLPKKSRKDSDAGRGWGQEKKGTTEDEMAGWHHRLNGRESKWTTGVGDGQGDLAAIHGVTRSQTQLSNWTELNLHILVKILLVSSYRNLIKTT